MYPPKKKPLTQRNTYKKKATAANTYKSRPKKSGISSAHLAAGAIIAGGVFAWMSAMGSSSKPPLPKLPSAAGGNGGPSATTPKPAPAPASAPPPPPKVVIAPPINTTVYLVVDSFNGEGIFRETKANYTLDTGYGKHKILHLPNKRFVGIWTGRVQNNMLEAYISMTNSKYNVWVDQKEVRKMNQAEYDAHKKTYATASQKTSAELTTIANHFKNLK